MNHSQPQHSNADVALEHDGKAGQTTGATAALKHLDDMDDCEIAEGEPDIRGWTVKTMDGIELGEVEDLLVDTGTMKVRYLEVEVDKDALDLREDRWVLIPVGAARLNDDEEVVMVSRKASDILSMPQYERGAFNPDYAKKLADGYGGNHFEDVDFYGNRRNSTAQTYIVRRRQD